MTDFETRVRGILNADTPNHVKLEKIRKICVPKIDPSTCKDDRIYRITVDGNEAIGWRAGDNGYQWRLVDRYGMVSGEKDSSVTVLGEYRQKDEHVGKVYERIEEALADGMGKYTVLEDSNGSRWIVDKGVGISNLFAPFTVLHWAPKEAEEE